MDRFGRGRAIVAVAYSFTYYIERLIVMLVVSMAQDERAVCRKLCAQSDRSVRSGGRSWRWPKSSLQLSECEHNGWPKCNAIPELSFIRISGRDTLSERVNGDYVKARSV